MLDVWMCTNQQLWTWLTIMAAQGRGSVFDKGNKASKRSLSAKGDKEIKPKTNVCLIVTKVHEQMFV